jgi:hypothetical protein
VKRRSKLALAVAGALVLGALGVAAPRCRPPVDRARVAEIEAIRSALEAPPARTVALDPLHAFDAGALGDTFFLTFGPPADHGAAPSKLTASASSQPSSLVAPGDQGTATAGVQ